MRTNIIIDDTLLSEALKLSRAKTKKEVIHLALEEYVRNNKKKNLIDLKGKICFSEDFDYKKMREG
ncbi:MAG: type II toxin-antitoxin system VapB family antitoxin [Bacillota bacterium]